MPHSSGGGSFSGGVHTSSSNSSSNTAKVNANNTGTLRTSLLHFEGATRYVYYKDGKANYVYSKADLSKAWSLKRLLWLLVFIPIILILVFLAIKTPEKLSTDYDTRIFIQDDINLFGGSDSNQYTNLYDSIKNFREETGITISVRTVYNEQWMAKTTLEDFAYNSYLYSFNDEKHWLIVLSVADDGLNKTNWYFEGIQGNDTDSILTKSTTQEFNKKLHMYLKQASSPDFSHALCSALNVIQTDIMNKRFNFTDDGGYIIAAFALLFIALIVVIYNPNRAYKGAHPCQYEDKESQCPKCNGTYLINYEKICPHCGCNLSLYGDY